MKIKMLLVLAACGNSSPEAAPTATDAPQPTATETDIPTPTLDLTATAEVQATADTAALLELIAPDLELAGYSTDVGSLAYLGGDPIEIIANEPGSRFWDVMDDPNPVFANFVMGIDVEWDSKTGVAGCDILFRAEQDLSRGEYVAFETMRLSGLPYWDFVWYHFNQRQAYLTGSDLKTNSAIKLDSGSLNHYVLVVDAATARGYANGTRLGTGTLPVAITEGRFGFQTWQESGISTCTFSNIWVWALP
jgi:hypothetical protein